MSLIYLFFSNIVLIFLTFTRQKKSHLSPGLYYFGSKPWSCLANPVENYIVQVPEDCHACMHLEVGHDVGHVDGDGAGDVDVDHDVFQVPEGLACT